MGRIFTRVRAASPVWSGARTRELSEPQRHELSARFEAAGEALAADPSAATTPGARTIEVCTRTGRDLADDGVPLERALEELCHTCLVVTGQQPAYDAVRSLAAGWSEATLGYLHQLSCEDPLTGLASLAHVRSRLSELYRDQVLTRRPVRASHVLVLLDGELPVEEREPFGSALRTTRMAETARTAFHGGHTIGRVGRERIAVLVARDETLGRRVGLLRRLLVRADPPVRVWLESLPADDRGAAVLLDELARA